MADFLIGAALLRDARARLPEDERLGLAERDAAPARPTRAETATGRWIAEDGETALGDAFEIGQAGTTAVEAFWPSGQIERAEIDRGIAFEAEPPEGAGFLRLAIGASEAFDAPLAGLRSSGPMPHTDPVGFGPAAARFRFPVFSERFTDRQKFVDSVASLYDWISNVPPFTQPAVREAFAIDGYFWASPGASGHFGTRDIIYDCAHPPASAAIFSGDNAVAGKRLRHLMLDGRYGLVLIDSPVRGGAGGIADARYPAWVSISSCPGEAWQAVALHEMGHALDLADEYLDAGLANRTADGEPNCAISGVPASADWRARFTDQPPGTASVYSLERQRSIGQPGGPAVPAPDFVGLFQGARYRTDYYRPSYQCLMRATNVHRFCPVCADHLRARIVGDGGGT